MFSIQEISLEAVIVMFHKQNITTVNVFMTKLSQEVVIVSVLLTDYVYH